MYLILYHPEGDCSTISIFSPFAKVPIILYEVESPDLTFKSAVVCPCLVVSGVESGLEFEFKLTYLLDIYPYEPLYLILYHPEDACFIISTLLPFAKYPIFYF